MTTQGDKTGPRPVSGRKIVLGSLIGCALIAALLTLLIARATLKPAPPLDYAERARWPALPARPVGLDAEGRPPFEGSPLRRIELEVAEKDLLTIQRLAVLAWGFDDSQQTRTLLDKTRARTRGFYILWLCAQWHAAFGDADAARDLFTEAAAVTPAFVVVRFVDAAQQPAAGLAIGTVEIACARVVDDGLDDGLRLVYPKLVTDRTGRIYLPVPQTALKITYLGATDDPRFTDSPVDRWFDFPGAWGRCRMWGWRE